MVSFSHRDFLLLLVDILSPFSPQGTLQSHSSSTLQRLVFALDGVFSLPGIANRQLQTPAASCRFQLFASTTLPNMSISVSTLGGGLRRSDECEHVVVSSPAGNPKSQFSTIRNTASFLFASKAHQFKSFSLPSISFASADQLNGQGCCPWFSILDRYTHRKNAQ